LSLFFLARFAGVLCAGVVGARGVLLSTALRKRMKFALLKFKRRRVAYLGGERRTGRGGVSNAALMFVCCVRRVGRLGVLGVVVVIGLFVGVLVLLLLFAIIYYTCIK
jgi:hypothetical protein